MRKKLMRVLSLVLAAVMTFTSVDLSAFAAEANGTGEEALKEELRNMVSDEEHPNGVFELGHTMITMSEGKDGIISVVRAGNTDTAASVVFKAVDISAVYGQDYTLSVERSFFGDDTLEANPDAVPLLQAYGEVAGAQVSAETDVDPETAEEILDSLEADAAAEETGAVTDEVIVEDDSDIQSEELTKATPEDGTETVTAENAADDAADSQDDDAKPDESEEVELTGPGSSLMNAYEAQTGEAPQLYDWREYNEKEVSEEDVENLNASNEQAKEDLAMLDGVTVKLNFKKGEYRKDIKVYVIDDSKSESDEQVLLVLQDAVNSEIGENYNGYLNITDNDEQEDVIYSVREKEITAGADDSYVTVTIERTSGIDRMDIVTVGTQAVDAEPDVDYETIRTDVLFAPGVTERTVDVMVNDSSRSEERHFYVGVKSESGQVEDTANACLVTLLPTADSDAAPPDSAASASDEVEALGWTWQDNAEQDVLMMKDFTNWGANGDVNGSDSRYMDPYNQYGFIDLSSYDYIYFDIECWGETYHWWKANNTNKTFHLELFSDNGDSWSRVANYELFIEGEDTKGPGRGIFAKTRRFGVGFWTKDFPGDLSKINIHPWVQAGRLAENVDMWCRINYICLGKMPCEIRVENTNEHNYYTEKQWTGPDKYTEIGEEIRYPAVYLDKGNLKGKGVRDDVGVYYTGDSVVTTQESNPTAANSVGVAASSDVVELKGFKVLRQGANHLLSNEVLPLDFKIDMNFKKKWYNGEYLFKGDSYDRIVLVPYYEPKTATVRFTNAFKTITNSDGSTKDQGGYNNFDESSVLNVNKLDTIKLSAFANAPSAVTKITLSGKKAGEDAVMASTGRDSAVNNPPTSLITHFGDRDLVDYQFGIEYDTTLLKVMPDPKLKDGEDIKRGSIVYVPEGEKAIAKEGGESLTIPDVNMYETYTIGAVTDREDDVANKGKYKVMWRDGTLDTDEDGEWVENNPNYTSFVPSAGNSLSYTTKLPQSRIYYSFVPKTTAQAPAPIVGWLELEDKILLSGVTKTVPINGATVYADDVITTTKKGSYKGAEGDGFYQLDRDTFSVLDNYLVTINYTGNEGSITTAVNQLPGRAQKIAVKTYEDLTIDGVKLAQGKLNEDTKKMEYTAKAATTDGTGYFTGWTNGDHNYRIQMTPSANSVSIYSGILEFYDKTGAYVTAVEGEKDTKTGEFTFDFNPTKVPYKKITTEMVDGKAVTTVDTGDDLELTAGTTLAVKFTDNNKHEYMRREVGIELRQTMGTKDVINMFIGGKNATMDLLGKVDMLLDLGWSGDFDDLDADDAGNKVLAIGFNKDVVSRASEKKSVDKELKNLSDAEQAKADKQKELQKVMDQYSGEAANSEEAEKAMKDAIKEVEEAEAKRSEAQKSFDENVGKATKPNTKNTKLGGKVEMSFEFSFMLTFAYDNTEAKYYFKEMVLTASLTGSLEGSVEFATPIGVTVTITLTLSGNAKATFVIETRGEKDASKRYYVSADAEDKTINIWNFDQSNDNRQNDAWGAFEFTPTIALSVKAGILGDLVSVKVTGSAAFNLVVYAGKKDSDAGKVRLHAGLEVKVIVATFKVDFVNKDVPLYGAAENIEKLETSLMDELEVGNILYEPASGFESEDVSYMAGGSTWYGDDEDIMALGANTRNPNKFIERSLADKIGTDPCFDLAYLGDGRYAGVYLDVPADRVDDRDNSRAVYYTYYDGYWAEPVILEDDSTLDAAPSIFSLGDRGAIIIWPSSSYKEQEDSDEDKTIAKLNSLDLHAKLINKDGSLDDKLLEITKSTTDANADKYKSMKLDWGDVSSDSSPVVAYNDNKMIIYYQKKYYDSDSKSLDEALVGDVLYPTLTVMAYRSYDFTTGEWDETGMTTEEITNNFASGLAGLTAEEKEERTKAFNECYYGQRFLHSLPNVVVIDEIDETTGYRKAGTEPKISESKATPVILDTSACSYDNWGVFAYSVDVDGDLKTTADREIYLQAYSFEDNEMSAPIILTGDEVSDTNVDLVHLNDSTWLSWLRDGDIVSTNLTYFADFWENTLTEKDGYYIVDKTEPKELKAGVYVPPAVIVRGDKADFDENADKKSQSNITTFQSEGYGDKIYYIWSKNGTALKEGIEKDSPEADNPANLVVERQLYSARAKIEKADIEGSIISYAEDISLPIQLTDKNGMNYDYVSFDVDEDEGTGLVWRAPSKTETSGGVTYPVVDETSAEPVGFWIMDIGTAEIMNAEINYAQAGDVAAFSFDVLNDGFEPLEKLTVKAVDQNGKSVLTETKVEGTTETEDGVNGDLVTNEIVDSIEIDSLEGGHTRSFMGMFDLDEDATEAEVTITVADSSGAVVRTLDVAEKLEAYVVFDELKVEPTDVRGIYHVSGTAVNMGTAKSGNNSKMILGYRSEVGNFVQVGASFGYDDPLAPGESVELETDLEIPDDCFVVNKETDKDGNVSISETFTLMIKTDRDTYAETTIERTANSDEYSTVQNIKSMTVYDGNTLSFNASDFGNSFNLSPQVETIESYKENGYVNKDGNPDITAKVDVTGAENLKYRYEVVESSPADAVSVDDMGNLTVNKAGTGTIRVSAFYSDGTLQAKNSTTGDTAVSSTTVDDFVNRAKDAIYAKDYTFTVYNRKDTDKKVAGGLAYYVSGDDTVTCAGVEGTANKVTIPATIKIDGKTYKVESIEAGAFANNATITSVNIGKNVKTIGAEAFKGCTALSSVSFGAGVTEIQKGAFEDCAALKTVSPKANLTTIGENAFKGCYSLTTVTIPKNVTTIGGSAFEDCGSLKKVNVKSTSITSIGDNAFYNVSLDCAFTLAGSASQKAAFQKLTTWEGEKFFDKNGIEYDVSVSGGNIVEVAGIATNANAKNGAITIPASVKYKGITYKVTGIDSNAFAGNTLVKKVTIGKNVTTIEANAFENCTALTTVKIPANVAAIEEDTFKGCTALNKVTLGKNLVKINESAFEGCSGLVTIKIPAKVTEIRFDAFKDCTSLKKVTFGKNLRTIGDSAFEGCSQLTSIVLPANVLTIGDDAFRNCSSVKTVTIKSLINIGSDAFEGIQKDAVIKVSVKKALKDKVKERLTTAVGINVLDGMMIK